MAKQWTGLYDGQNSTGYSLLVNVDPATEYRSRNVFSRMGANKLEGLLNALIGASAGGAASMTRKRIAAQANGAADCGGKRVIETVTDISKTTTAADVTRLKALFVGVKFQPTYPGDKSKNGK